MFERLFEMNSVSLVHILFILTLKVLCVCVFVCCTNERFEIRFESFELNEVGRIAHFPFIPNGIAHDIKTGEKSNENGIQVEYSEEYRTMPTHTHEAKP